MIKKTSLFKRAVDAYRLRALRNYFARDETRRKWLFGFEVEIPLWNKYDDYPADVQILGPLFDSTVNVLGRDGAPRLVEIRFPPRNALWWLSDEPLIILERYLRLIVPLFEARDVLVVANYNDEYFASRVDPRYPIVAGIHFHFCWEVARLLGLIDYEVAYERCQEYAEENLSLIHI